MMAINLIFPFGFPTAVPHLGHILSEHSEFIDECMSCQGTSEGAFTKGMCVKDGV